MKHYEKIKTVRNEKVKKIKTFLSKDKLDQLINYIKNIDYRTIFLDFIKKLQAVKKEDIYDFYLSHKNNIFFLLFIVLDVSLLVLFLIGVKKLITVKQKLDEAVSKVEIVSDKKYINLIKKNKLRTLTTLTDVTYTKLYNSFNSSQYKKLQSKLKFFILFLMAKSSNSLYSNYIRTLFLSNGLVFSTKQNLFSKNLSKLISKVDFKSPIILSYLSSFPNAQVKTSDKALTTFMQVLSHLYEYELISILSLQKAEADNLENIYDQYQAPYKYFLSYIYLPRINIWENPFSKHINPDIFGSAYLNKASYIDINLIKYWANFFSQSYSGLLYQGKQNNIIDIKLSSLKPSKEINIMKVNLGVRFQLSDDQSFYGLISKLTLTSNIKNIMLLNEFTYHLWNNIKDNLNKELSNLPKNLSLGYKLLYYNIKFCYKSTDKDCLRFFGCKSLNSCNKTDIYDDTVTKLLNSKTITQDVVKKMYLHILTLLKSSFKFNLVNSSFYKYISSNYQSIDDINVLLGARLFDCIKNKGYCGDLFDSRYSQIVQAIKQFANCSGTGDLNISDVCKMKFIEKFDTNYFIAYTMVDRLGQISYSLLDRLKDVYNNIPTVLQLGNFKFSKLASSNFTNNILVKYNSNVDLSLYYKYLTIDDYNNILAYIGHVSCKSVTNGKSWSLSIAYDYVNNIYNQLYKTSLGASATYNLKKLLGIIHNLQSQTKKAYLLDKLLANLQVYRIFKERGYCK